MDRGKHVETDLVDFVPHPPSCVTFGQFRFCVEKEGSYRLEVPISSGLSAVDSDSSSGEEEIPSSRFINTMASEKLAKIFSDMSFESSADSDISSDSDNVDSFNFIDRSAIIGKVFTNLYDGVTNPDKNQNSKYHQIYAIEETNRAEPETSEAFDNVGNPYVDPADLERGLGTKYVGPTPRLRVQLPQKAWDRAARAMDGSEPMTTTATSLVNTLERVALNVVQEIMKHKYSPSGPVLGTHQGEIPLYTRPPLQYTMAAPQQQGSPAYVVYKVGGDPGDYQFLYEPSKEIPHGYVCTYVPDATTDDPVTRGRIATQEGSPEQE
ncbi:hypothetical protein QYE76_009554 [Lolium multiflorum]|uniref:Uncharacterized protein n=1 Tax=Lolium multiflorum TaxID=4521 RepID=A0AAD8TTV3_LOLMU|nr:hypothetical protein QYE76_009554 [Lolium multiflorum]